MFNMLSLPSYGRWQPPSTLKSSLNPMTLQDAATAHLLAELEAEEAAEARKAGDKAKRRKSKAAARRAAADSASEVSPPELLPAGVRIDEVRGVYPSCFLPSFRKVLGSKGCLDHVLLLGRCAPYTLRLPSIRARNRRTRHAARLHCQQLLAAVRVSSPCTLGHLPMADLFNGHLSDFRTIQYAAFSRCVGG